MAPAPLPDQPRWEEIDLLFQSAIERPAGERESFLAEAAVGDAELLREVKALLDSCDTAEMELGESAARFAEPLLATFRDDVSPTTFGPYRLLEEIGRGGMGTVYRAERADAEFEKQVAIKVVKRGMDTDEVLRRFRNERQILASLEHPNVARLYDGGVSPDGRPYLVMEYIEGRPITAYCDERRLGIDERLALFRTVCRAVQFAHQNLVVHRDIKPSNILVNQSGEVKLLDFGIAKLLDQSPTPDTRTETRILTPDYASPEQILGRPVTTASDVYALGVVLYELLTGRRPYSPASVGDRTVLEREIPRPSAAVEGEKSRRLRGDLDTVALKALEPERERRYQSALELLGDIDRYLEGQPVLARPATLGYRTRKFIGRHRAGVAVGSALAVLALAFGLYHSSRITRERDLAERQRDKARQVVGFLTEMLAAADPLQAQGDTLTVFDVLARSEARLDTALVAQPEVREELWRVMGATYRELGENARARRVLDSAYALGRALRGDRDSAVIETASDLAAVLQNVGERDSAEQLVRQVLKAQQAFYGEEHLKVASSLNHLGQLRWAAGDFEGAAGHIRQSLAMNRRLGAEPEILAFNLNDLGAVLRSLNRNAEAEPVLREALELRETALGPNHPSVATTMLNLAAVLRDAGRYAVAESLFRESLTLRRRAFGSDHPELGSSFIGLGLTLHAQGDYAGAEAAFREALDLYTRTLGPEHPEVGMSLYSLGVVAEARGDSVEAERLYRQALAVLEPAAGPDHPNTAQVRGALGSLLTNRGDPLAGERLLRGAAEAYQDRYGPSARRTVAAEAELGWSLAEQGRLAEAESLMARSYRSWPAAATARDSIAHQRLHARLIELYHRMKLPERADALTASAP